MANLGSMKKVNKQRPLQLSFLGLLSLSVFIPTPVLSQNSTFPEFARCLEGDSLAGSGDPEGNYRVGCISCSTVVRVDSASGRDCTSPRHGGVNLNGSTCRALDPVLDSIMLGHTSSWNCIEVAVAPRSAEERYVVSANKTIRQSIVLRSMSEVSEWNS